jgi:hypothetical protein
LPPMRDGGRRPLDRKGIVRAAGHAIMPTCKGDLFTIEQTLDEGDSLCQPARPCSLPHRSPNPLGRNMDEPKRRRDQQCRMGRMGDAWNVARAALFRSVLHEK